MAGQYARPVNRTRAMPGERSQAAEDPVERCRCVRVEPDRMGGMISEEKEAEAVARAFASKSISIDLSRTVITMKSWR